MKYKYRIRVLKDVNHGGSWLVCCDLCSKRPIVDLDGYLCMYLLAKFDGDNGHTTALGLAFEHARSHWTVNEIRGTR